MASRSTALVPYLRSLDQLGSLNRRACVLGLAIERIWMEALEARTLLSGGELDTTFGHNGVASALNSSVDSSSGGSASVDALAVLPNDKILAVGQVTDFPALALFNADGSLDTSFGSGGVATLADSIGGGELTAVLPQSDGKILVAGDAYRTELFVARYNADGSLDSTFAQAGIATVPLVYGTCKSLSVESNGQILALGELDSSYAQMAVVRFNADGSLDASFGSGGIATIQGNTSDTDEYADLATVGADGSITVFGQGTGDTSAGYAAESEYVVQLTPAGQKTSIREYRDPASPNGWSGGTVQGPDGKIVALGSSLFRFNANGTPDDTFGTDGTLGPLSQTAGDTGVAVGVREDGAIFVIGQDYTLERYNPDGTVDTRFGDGGIATIASNEEEATAIGFQSDGDIIVGGTGFDLERIDAGTDLTAPEPTQPTTLQYPVAAPSAAQNAAAQPQLISFASTNITSGTVGAVAVEPNGQILAAGSCRTDAAQSNEIALALFNPDGTLDTSFGNSGTVTISAGGDDVAINSVVLLGQGQILVGGDDDTQGCELLAKFNADGSLDQSFGTSGIATATPPQTWWGFYVGGVSPELSAGPDGSFVVWGGGSGSFIARFNADGSPDLSFATDGVLANLPESIVSVAFNPDDSLVVGAENKDAQGNETGEGILLSPTGQEIGVKPGVVESSTTYYVPLATLSNGSTLSASNYGFSLVQAAPGGELDAGSGGTGSDVVAQSAAPAPLTMFNLQSSPGNSWCNVSAAAVQSDGQILVAGYGGGDTGPDPQIGLARFNADGTLDTSFGDGGAINISSGSEGDDSLFVHDYVQVYAVEALPNGQIELACSGNNWFAPESFMVIRFNADGTLDRSFGSGGAVDVPLSGPLNGMTLIYNGSPGSGHTQWLTGMTMESDGSTIVYGADENQVLLAHFNADGSLDTSFGTGGVLTTMANADDDCEQAASVAVNRDGSMVVNITGQDAWGDLVAYNMRVSATGQQLAVTATTPVPANGYTPLLTLPDGSTLSISPDGSSLLQYAAGVDPTKPVYTAFGAPWNAPTATTSPTAPSPSDVTDLNQYVRPVSAFGNQTAPADGFANFLASSNPLASFSHVTHKPDDWMDSGADPAN